MTFSDGTKAAATVVGEDADSDLAVVRVSNVASARLHPGAIQTDASINHGSSDGPLLDAAGRVVGINAQIESPSGGNVGVGLAIPSDTVRSVTAAPIAGRPVELGAGS